MQVIAQPFVTREAVLSVLRPGELTSERPFRTLREHGAASEGLTVPLRGARGQVLGRIQLYGSLNADAARAYRLRQLDSARKLASRAHSIERSPAARTIRNAVASAAVALSSHEPAARQESPALRRYIDMRRRSTGQGLDVQALVREWLSHADAWLQVGSADRDTLLAAATELDREASQAREEVLGSEISSATTFFGVVRRIDPIAAEIEGSVQTLLVPREDLDRQGLAVIGQPVAILRELLPSGGSYSLPMPAVALGDESFARSPHSWEDVETTITEEGETETRVRAAIGSMLEERDRDWLDRELARRPSTLLVAPLPVA